MQFIGSKSIFFGHCPIFCHHHDWTPKRQHFCVDPVARRASGRPPGPDFGPKFCIFLRYAYITPICSGPTDPTQWDHKSPISWGNSGYLRFSCRWPFGRLAGRFVAPIAQSGPFVVQKSCFLARNHFFVNSHATESTQKCCLFGVQSLWRQKNWTILEKKWISGQKTAFLARKSAFGP